MFASERTRPAADRLDFITVATPNHKHLPIARAALGAGFAVMSDKPATATLAAALESESVVRQSSARYTLSYTHSGYPMVREARALIADGMIGTVRKVVIST